MAEGTGLTVFKASKGLWTSPDHFAFTNINQGLQPSKVIQVRVDFFRSTPLSANFLSVFSQVAFEFSGTHLLIVLRRLMAVLLIRAGKRLAASG
jgi:hypothetical protein